MSQAPQSVQRLERAREGIRAEAQAITGLLTLVGSSFEEASQRILECRGRVVVTGMGKAGLIGAKISATLASTGSPSYFLHPAEAIHGDLGRVRSEDVVLALSNSGESEEVVRLIDPLRRIGSLLIGMTGQLDSSLARNCDIVLDCGRAPEACPLGLAPTASTAAMLALGDALAMSVLGERGFGTEDFARYHPGGSLGRELLRVEELMRRGERVTFVPPTTLARDVLIAMNATPGRPGAAVITGPDRSLAGFFTDGDLARRLQEDLSFLERPIAEVMIPEPLTIGAERLASEALRLMRERKVDQLPVVGAEGQPVGLIDVQDLLAARVV